MTRRYGAVAMLLHWIVAGLIVANLVLAWKFEGLEAGAERGALIRLHKSIGLTVLFLSLARLGWRLIHRPPPNPRLSPLERRLSLAAHRTFYALMLAIPLSGWAMISAATDGRPTKVWGVLDWPRIKPLAELGQPLLDRVHGALQASHLTLALMMVVLLVLHVAGALKHQLFDRNGAGLVRMLPGRGMGR